jgi:FkbM family methyltransferase
MNKFLKKIKFFNWIYKIQKIYKNSFPNKHFAQFGEDILVSTIFRNIKKGFYIDIGAYHPFKGSLTYNLYKKGWQGVNIDLSKASIELFQIARPSDTNINCAISSENKETFYYENSPINQQNSLTKQSDNQKKISINSYKLETILKKNGFQKVDYINIDTEGNEIEILRSVDFEKVKPILITLEDNSFIIDSEQKVEKIKFMKENNYELINIIGVTLFFLRKDYLNTLQEIHA